MTRFKTILIITFGILYFCHAGVSAKSLEEVFTAPERQHKPLIIWQWMDGLVTKEGITKDLEAFKEAGLAGVQNFQIGGPRQMRIGNPDNKIGSDNWKELMRWTLDECERLGLTFGTHNCPGWSSSAFVNVRPEYSMMELIYTEAPLNAGQRSMILPKPGVDPAWDYYEDVAIMLVPTDSVANTSQIIDVTKYFNRATGRLTLPEHLESARNMSALRIGQTTIGKTNESQSPESGGGLECDKLSRKAVAEFWNGYPKMIIDLAGHHAGKTFTNFEIDSYEAGGQAWSPVLPDEFMKRAGYGITPYLPYMVGRLKTIDNEAATKKFRKDWQEVVTQCVAENYYGYLTQLCTDANLGMLIEPYGTGGRKPFDILDFYKIVNASKGAEIATEFWQYPNWGWKDMGRHEAAMRKLQRPLLVAEAFTCWPANPWQDSPKTLKPVCDRAFCSGVNRMMLHAGAANPWPGVEPGMSFGFWGTQFVPGQTWWKAGGAHELFGYMARCQALLQQGLPAKEQLPPMEVFKTYHRVDEATDIIFVCNPTAAEATDTVTFDAAGRAVELWDPYTISMNSLSSVNKHVITIEPFGSRFLIFRNGVSNKPSAETFVVESSMPVNTGWTVAFHEIGEIELDSLISWPDHPADDIKYYSGTATYKSNIRLDRQLFERRDTRVILSLGDVKNMASLTINGHKMPLMWKSPYTCDITDYAHAGDNRVEIEVTNLWPNRMIGDEHEPDDLEWSEPLVYTYAPGSPEVGRYLLSNPEWLQRGLPRPSQGRKSVGCFKFFKADSPLLPSGLLGPVEISLIRKI